MQTFSYDYFKEIEVKGNSKYKEFYITEDIYLKSKNDLGDIRILDSEGQEIPYVIEKKEAGYNNIEKTVSVGNIISETAKEEKMETVFKFSPQNKLDDIFGNRIEIIPKRNFYFEYELLGSSNGKNWEYITYGEIYKTPDKENLLIDFSAEKYTYYKLITDLSKERQHTDDGRNCQLANQSGNRGLGHTVKFLLSLFFCTHMCSSSVYS